MNGKMAMITKLKMPLKPSIKVLADSSVILDQWSDHPFLIQCSLLPLDAHSVGRNNTLFVHVDYLQFIKNNYLRIVPCNIISYHSLIAFRHSH